MSVVRATLDLDSSITQGVLYVDADWMSGGSPLWSLSIPTDASRPEGDPDREAGSALLGVAMAAAGELEGLPAHRIEVIGTGFIAGALRRLCGAAARPPMDRPAAVVDTTGDPERLRDAIRRLDDLGTLILAGVQGEQGFELDLYPDIHLRGLRIVGVPPARVDASAPAVPDDAIAYLEAEPPAPIRAGEPLPSAAWYRLN